mmetsp:Transcript_23037/g.20465  ORF Transcript_23037/g.20465 Transcript_23037/m.20465 type:complete len:417 (+) Transcript_23037:126-1376(+)
MQKNRKLRPKETHSGDKNNGRLRLPNRHALPEEFRNAPKKIVKNMKPRRQLWQPNKIQNKTQVYEESTNFETQMSSNKSILNNQIGNEMHKIFHKGEIRPQHDLLKMPPVGSILQINEKEDLLNKYRTVGLLPNDKNNEERNGNNTTAEGTSPLDILGSSALTLLRLREEINTSLSHKNKKLNPSGKSKYMHRRGVSEARKDLPVCFSSRKEPSPIRSGETTQREVKSKSTHMTKRKLEKDNPRDELEVLVESTMKDHKRLMRIFNKQKLLNRINDNRKGFNTGTVDEGNSPSPYSIIGSSGRKNKNFNDQQDQILPSRLIGESKELEQAYEEFLKEEKKNSAVISEDEDDQSDVDYHEGAIPRLRKRVTSQSSRSGDLSDQDTKLKNSKINMSFQYPKSIYKFLPGNNVSKLRDL